MDLENQINTIGIENGDGEIADISSRTQREAQVEQDYTNAYRAGAVRALEAVGRFAASKLEMAGPYDDVRAIEELQTWLADMIRSAHTLATDGPIHA